MIQNGIPTSQQVGAYNTYIGARYVPVFYGQWDNSVGYEPLTIVTHEGNSYTSKSMIPVGVDINNENYWVQTGNFNAQLAEVMRQLILLESENLNITSITYYGVKGDGSDETNLLQQALNDAATKGRVLKIPKGLVVGISDKVVIPSYTQLWLEGDILLLTADLAHLTTITGQPQPKYGGAHDVLIWGNGRINCNSLNLDNPTQTPLRFYHAKNIIVKGITIELYGTYHAIEIGGVSNMLVDSVQFKGTIGPATGEALESAIQIEPVYGPHGQNSAIPFDNTPCEFITINNCWFGKSLLGGNNVSAGVESQWQGNEDVAWHSGIVITNNRFMGLPHYAVVPHAWKNVIIADNYAENLQLSFIEAIDYGKDGIVNGLIKGNIVNGCNKSVTSLTSSHTFMTVGRCENIVVSDNIIKECLTPSVAILNTKEIIIQGNRFEVCTINQSNNNAYSYIYFNTCENVVITDNIFKGKGGVNNFFSANYRPGGLAMRDNVIEIDAYSITSIQDINNNYELIFNSDTGVASGSIPLGVNQKKYVKFAIKVELDGGPTDWFFIDICKSVYGSYAGIRLGDSTVLYDMQAYILNNDFVIISTAKSVDNVITKGGGENQPIKVMSIYGVIGNNVIK